MSTGWSCGTLEAGYKAVVGEEESERLKAQEESLLKEIQELELQQASADTLPGSPEVLKECDKKEPDEPPAVPSDVEAGDNGEGNGADGDEANGASESQEKPCQAAAPPTKRPRRVLSRRELLRNAAKARIRRMIAEKKHRTDLAVPPIVREQWEKGTREKDEMAQLLQDTNWDKEVFVQQLELVVRKKLKIKVTRNEDWFSESDLKVELKWGTAKIAGVKKVCEKSPKTHIRSNRYDGQLEYWVVIRETTAHTESKTTEENYRENKKISAAEMPAVAPDSFQNIDAHVERSKEGQDAAPEQQASSEMEHKAVVKRYMDSLLAKINKLRALIKDLKKNYSADSAGPVKTLEDNITKIDEKYEALNEHMATGETDGYGGEWWSAAEKKMKEATMVSSRATAAELKVKSAKKFYEKSTSEGSRGGADKAPGAKSAPKPKAKVVIKKKRRQQ